MSKIIKTDWFRFLGMNIKGTPSMRAEAVEADLLAARSKADVLVTQEFKWDWYWRVAKKVMGGGKKADRWASSPGFKTGFGAPVSGAQAAMWKRAQFKRVRAKRSLLHKGAAGISEHRYLRAVLLQDRETGLRCWFGTTHFVVGGDMPGDSDRRKAMLADNIDALDKFLAALTRKGHPVVFQLDANIKPISAAYGDFMRVLKKHEAKVHGGHGVEYLFSIPGRKADIEVQGNWIVSTRNLFTDHEGRGLTLRLVTR